MRGVLLVGSVMALTACGGAQRASTVEPTPGADTREPVPVAPPLGSAPREVVEVWSRDQLVPFQQWPALAPRTVGLIWQAGPQPWGASYGHMRQREAAPQRREYKFGVSGKSPFAVYFVSPSGQGQNPMRAWCPGPRGDEGTYDVAMFERTTPNPWGLHARAHLVEAEVNGGRGSRGGGVHFVITDLRVLDGTPDYPLSPEAVLIDLGARFERTMAELADERAGVLARRVAEVANGYEPDRPTLLEITVFPTWQPDTQTLDVLFVGERSQTLYGEAREVSQCPQCPPGAPCMPCGPPISSRPSVEIHVRTAVRYEVDRSGALRRETLYTTRAE